MAILKISKELIEFYPTLLDVVSEYFDSVVEMTPDCVNTRRFDVKKKDLPTDDTELNCQLECRKNGDIYISHCSI